MSHIPNVLQVKSSASHLKPGISKAAVDRFIEGLSEDLKPFRMRPTKKNRLQLSDRNVLQEWFGRFKTATENVCPANIYNFDETNFQIGRGNRV
ncbi:hypothetical protein N7509_009038 [Penicillium cosmopolitanum]|uniref:HTH CENPB-type domain-containing protein n=1 Tax=Penicillium cosmopolitanum TaxID=1131564 RepID=A0A9X0B394_9EURO|nr:uncharacterized protein N7509_009038 [Penicillium cosmopolitanum]KAJ5386497.1 hypothetical protein N7509_009038 [Penicillium cosmopolitanum]